MPQGCGTWPAFWETGPNWPYGGEVDIVSCLPKTSSFGTYSFRAQIEGVNDVSPNAMTLHTATGCTMPASRGPMTGTAGNNDCQWYNGCGVSATGSANSYGPPFNNNGGGWYAMERNNDFIKVWFWPRNSNPPDDVRNGASSVNTDNWVRLPGMCRWRSLICASPGYSRRLLPKHSVPHCRVLRC